MPETAVESLAVTELMSLFRAGLLAILPVMERARLPWKGDGTSDPWDKVQEALYDAMITGCLENIVTAVEIKPLAPYGYFMAKYEAHSFLSARDLRLAGNPNAFVDLTNNAAPFDSATFQELGPDLKPSGGRIIRSLEAIDFEIALRCGTTVSYSDEISFRL